MERLKILKSIGIEMSTLYQTFGHYMNANLCCFFPGRIIDEVYTIVDIIPQRYDNMYGLFGSTPVVRVTREFKDISIMARDHFAKKIKKTLDKRDKLISKKVSTSFITLKLNIS